MHDYVEMLYQALASPYGIVVDVDQMERARQAFYRARKADPEFEKIAILQSPLAPNSQLWLVKKVPDDAPSSDNTALTESDFDPV